MIVMIVAIGLTGMASAGSTMDYDVDFSAAGTGSVQISTFSPVGTDIQIASWTNCVARGSQDGTYNNGDWLVVDRTTKVSGIQGDAASAKIITASRPTTPVADPNKSAVVVAVATYEDDYVNTDGGYIRLNQEVDLYDSDMPVVNDAGDERAYVNTEINGYAYSPVDNAANVNGSISMITDGSITAATGISVTVNDGDLNMDAQALITDNTADVESAKVNYNIRVTSPADTADGVIQGYASVNGVIQNIYTATYENADISAIGYFYAVTP